MLPYCYSAVGSCGNSRGHVLSISHTVLTVLRARTSVTTIVLQCRGHMTYDYHSVTVMVYHYHSITVSWVHTSVTTMVLQCYGDVQLSLPWCYSVVVRVPLSLPWCYRVLGHVPPFLPWCYSVMGTYDYHYHGVTVLGARTSGFRCMRCRGGATEELVVGHGLVQLLGGVNDL